MLDCQLWFAKENKHFFFFFLIHTRVHITSLFLICREEFLLGSHFWKHRRKEWSVQGESRGWDSQQGNTVIYGKVFPPLKWAPSRFPLSFLSRPSLHPYTHLPGLLSEICQNTFHTNRYFSAFKASFDLLDKPKQLKFCEISKASQASLFFFFLQASLNTPLPVL